MENRSTGMWSLVGVYIPCLSGQYVIRG